MNNIIWLSAQQLRQAADLQEEIQELQKKLSNILGGEVPTPLQAIETPKKKRKMSAAGRKAIAEAAKARWAKYNAAKPAKGKMGAAAKAEMAALMKARWAKAKKAVKAKL